MCQCKSLRPSYQHRAEAMLCRASSDGETLVATPTFDLVESKQKKVLQTSRCVKVWDSESCLIKQSVPMQKSLVSWCGAPFQAVFHALESLKSQKRALTGGRGAR